MTARIIEPPRLAANVPRGNSFDRELNLERYQRRMAPAGAKQQARIICRHDRSDSLGTKTGAHITPIHSIIDADTITISRIVQRFGGTGGDGGVNADAVSRFADRRDALIGDDDTWERLCEASRQFVASCRRVSPR